MLPLSNSSETTLEILKELECKNIMIQGSDPAETKGLISYFLKIGKENLGVFKNNNINDNDIYNADINAISSIL